MSAAQVMIEQLSDADISKARTGSHVILEAAGGALLHAIRLDNGLLTLRGGQVRHLQVTQRLPAAATVRYPPPFGACEESQFAQAANRATSCLGLSDSEVVECLERAGAEVKELVTGGDALMSELLCTWCVTGVALCWSIAEAYRSAKQRGTSTDSILLADAGLGCSPGQAAGASHDASACKPLPESAAVTVKKTQDLLQPKTPSVTFESLAQTGDFAEGTDSTAKLKAKVQEKALATAVHMGLRGPAARAAGAVAAVGVEGYALYQEIVDHADKHEQKTISVDQFQERICESAVSSSGRAIGGLAGAAAGQAAIPVPIVGAVVGGVVGAVCGGFHAESLLRGASRLTGSKAKGGDDLVRCVEHQGEANAEQASFTTSQDCFTSGCGAHQEGSKETEDML